MSFWIFCITGYIAITYIILYAVVRYQSLYKFADSNAGNAALVAACWPLTVFIVIGYGLVSVAANNRLQKQ